FQAEDGIRDPLVTGVQTCALPISPADKPGADHKKLEPLVGNWTFTMKMWGEPGKPPQEGKGTAEEKWVVDGHFLQEDVHSDSFRSEERRVGKECSSRWLQCVEIEK